MNEDQTPQSILSNAKKLGSKVKGTLNDGRKFFGYAYSIESKGGRAYWEIKADRDSEGTKFSSDDVTEIELV